MDEQLAEYVQDIIERDIPVVVEGKKDARALRSFGVKNIVEMDTCFKVVDRLENEKEVSILVDLDREGKKMYAKLNDAFSRRGVKVNNKLRHFLFRETKIRQIEGLGSLMTDEG
ncbi:MAG TPA: toprim domain-containing protein [Candidatus Nanoarchaeia archaeon]|nr:toprim domain-containing protein [Candidatus Nanoarchaeia archaeon]